MKYNSKRFCYETEDFKPIELHPELDYKLDVDELGNQVVVKDKERDIQAEINSYADDCSIYKILERHNAGDLTALNQHTGIYVTKEMAEAANDFVNGMTADQSLYNAYTKFGSDKLSFDDFSKMVKNGQWTELLDIANGKVESNEGGAE